MDEPILLSRILVTNDDGIDAPGLKTLIDIAKQFAEEVWVFAPEDDISAAASRLNIQDPIRVRARSKNKYAVRGTPADCVILALEHFMKEAKPDLVLSGINPGENIATDVPFSGTIGAARAALMTGVPALAISIQSTSHEKARWDTARAVLPPVLSHLLETGWRKDTILNINIPDLPAEEIKGMRWTEQGEKNHIGGIVHAMTSPRNEDYFWIEFKDAAPTPSEVDEMSALENGDVSVTILSPVCSLPAHKKPLRFEGGCLVEVKEEEPEKAPRDILDELDGEAL